MKILEDILYWYLDRTMRNIPPPPNNDMNITADHWIEGVKRDHLEGGAHMGTRRFLVIHHTAGWGGQTSIDGWKKLGNGVCAHIVIDRDGAITQCRPFDRTCGHAGPSAWRDPNTGKLYPGSINGCSIGIELANCGTIVRETYPITCGPKFFNQPIPRLMAAHKGGGAIKAWEVYPEAQLAACEAVSLALVKRYNLDDVIGHEDCAPDRKVDPGPAFPMAELRNACGFTEPLAKLD